MIPNPLTHYPNGKPKSEKQMAYEARVKKSNEALANDPLLQTMVDFSPLGTIRDVDQALKAGDMGDIALAGATALAGPLAGPALKAGTKALKSPMGKKAVQYIKTPQPGYVKKDLLNPGLRRKYDNLRLTDKERRAADLVPGGEETIRNMKFEAMYPELADARNLGKAQKVRPDVTSQGYHGPGKHEMHWRPYDTKDGKTISATIDPKGNIQNILDVPGRPKSQPVPKPFPAGEGEFDVVTYAMKDAGYPGDLAKISKKIKHPGPLGAPKKLSRYEELMAKGIIKP